MATVTISIRGVDLPGRRLDGLPGSARPTYANVHVGVQRRAEVVDLVAGDAAEAVWTLDVDVATGRDGRLDLRGPWVHGRPGDRFIYLGWVEVGEDGVVSMFRRAKLLLAEIDEAALRQAATIGGIVEGRLALTDARGEPVCAAVRPPRIRWSLATT